MTEEFAAAKNSHNQGHNLVFAAANRYPEVSGQSQSKWLDLNQRAPTSKVGEISLTPLHLDILILFWEKDSNLH